MREKRPTELDFERVKGAFGREMRAAFRMPEAPVLEAQDLRFGPLAVTEIRCDTPGYGESAPIGRQDALLLTLQLRPSTEHDILEDGQRLPGVPLAAGMINIYDLRRGVVACSSEPFHALNFNVPLGAIEEAHEEPLSLTELDASERLGLVDPVACALGLALVPALANPEQTARLFVEHVLFAMRFHVAKRFGIPERTSQVGGLAHWQERRARELIDARLADDLSLGEVARECELSVAQFARAFKRTTGKPPYRFLLERRIERARELLLFTDQPLAEVAVACGFADQSHFTKAFRKAVGASPGSFRAARKSPRR